MRNKPTYQDLERKVRELESRLEKAESRLRENIQRVSDGRKGVPQKANQYQELFDNLSSAVAVYEVRKEGEEFLFVDFNKAAKKTDNEKKEAEVNAALSEIFAPLTQPFSSIDVMARTVLEKALALTKSRHGYVSEIDPNTGDNMGHTLTEMMAGECDLAKKGEKITFPMGPGDMYGGLWGHCLNTAKPFFTNNPDEHPATIGLPDGHIPLENFLSVPVVLGNVPVGQIALSNKPGGYEPEDLDAVTRMAGMYALAIQRFRIESAVVQSERFAKKVIESSLNGIYIYDLKQHKIVFINRQYTVLTGHDLEHFESMGKETFNKLFHPLEKEKLRNHFAAIQKAADGDVFEIEYRFKSAAGEWIWCLSRDAVFDRAPDGSVRQFIGTFQDITDRKNFEITLQKGKSELGKRVEELKCLYDISHLTKDPLLPLDEVLLRIARRIPPAMQYPNNTEALISLKARGTRQREKGSYQARTPSFPNYHGEFVSHYPSRPLADEDSWIISGDVFVENRRAGVLHVYYPKKNHAPPLKEEKPFIQAIAGHIGSFIEQKRIEREIRNSTAILERVLDESPFGIAMYDVKTGRCFKANRLMGSIIGADLDYILARNFKTDKELIRIWNKWGLYEKLERAIQNNSRERLEVNGTSTLGKPMDLDCYITPITVGEIRYVLFSLHDISHFKKMQNDLTVAKKIAEIANQAKSDFLANMSHELRTPLNAIIGFSEILYDQYFGPVNEKQKEYIDHIVTSGRHLLSLINDILDLSKIEAGKMKLSLSPRELRPLLEDSLVMIKEKAMKHGIEVSLGIEQAEGLRIHTDERAFRQIMFNLLSNAARFTPDNGAIEVEAKKSGDEVFISVLDTGIGIDEKYHSRIFEEFYQVRPKSGLQNQGTGLGLSLARKLVDMHGGKIWVESRGEKYGTIVVFTMKAA